MYISLFLLQFVYIHFIDKSKSCSFYRNRRNQKQSHTKRSHGAILFMIKRKMKSALIENKFIQLTLATHVEYVKKISSVRIL